MPSASVLLTFLIAILLTGLALPVGISRGWLGAPGLLFLWLSLIWLLVIGPISDSFAGERDRRLLESLFATRLPDSAILCGKIAAVALYASIVISLALLMGGAVAYALASGQSATTSSLSLVALVALTPLAALLASTAGAMISLTAPSVRRAHQTAVALVPALALAGIGIDAVLDWSRRGAIDVVLEGSATGRAGQELWLVLAGIMLALTVLLYVVAHHRLSCWRSVPA